MATIAGVVADTQGPRQFLAVEPEVRRVVYTTNEIEALNDDASIAGVVADVIVRDD